MDSNEGTVEFSTAKPTLFERLKRHAIDLLGLSWPIIFTSFVESTVWLSSTFFVSHLGPQYISASTLGNMICNASGLSFGIGFSMGLDTLCTQAFGAKKYKLVGLHFQRAAVLLTILCIPIIGFWMFTEQILSLAGVDPVISYNAQLWIYWLMPGLWPCLIFEAFKRYLIAQKIVFPQTVSMLIVSPLHVGYSWLLVNHFGYIGAAIGSSISNWLWLIVTIIIYIIYKKYKSKSQIINTEENLGLTQNIDGDDASLELNEFEDDSNPLDTWPSLSLGIFGGWCEYLKLGVPTSLSLAVEWGSWEVNALIVAHLPSSTIELAAHSILSNTAGLWYTPALGVASAVTTCIGNSLGAGNAESAQIYYKIAYFVVLWFAYINGMAAVLYRWYWGRLWADDPGVILEIASNMWIMWAYGVCDAIKCIGSSILRACGRPSISLWVFIVSIIIGYPVSYILGMGGVGIHVNMGLIGIWIGMTVSWAFAGLVYIVIVFKTDWQKEVIEAENRNQVALLSTGSQNNTTLETFY